jgi:nucleotide-binding universal stress UspA family protein
LSGHVPFLTGVDHRALDEGRRHAQLSALRRRVHGTIGRSVHFSTGAEVGRTVDVIGGVARTRRSALVLSGLELKGASQRTSTEQLALRAMTAAGLPVLAVPVDTALLPRRALVAIDFESASIRAAQAALATASPDGTVTLVHVAAPTPGHSDAARVAFSRLLSTLRVPATIDVTTVILEGDVTAALLRFAAAGRYDLIAVGSRATARSEFRLAGTVCLALLRSAMGLVLVAPPAQRDTGRS